MKKLILSMLLVAWSSNAMACSISTPKPLQALQDLDMMFEGRVVAVYLNATQVSTSLVTDYLENAYGRVDIKIKVAPSRYYFGTEEAVVILSSFYEKDAPCGGDILVDTDERLWGVVKYKGRYWDGGWPDFAKGLLEAAQLYQQQLDQFQLATPTDNIVIQTDSAAIERLLALDKELREIDFIAVPTALEKLPVGILRARLEFLQALAFVGEQTRTQSAILMAE